MGKRRLLQKGESQSKRRKATKNYKVEKNTAKKDSQSQRKVYKNVGSKKPSKGWSQISEK